VYLKGSGLLLSLLSLSILCFRHDFEHSRFLLYSVSLADCTDVFMYEKELIEIVQGIRSSSRLVRFDVSLSFTLFRNAILSTARRYRTHRMYEVDPSSDITQVSLWTAYKVQFEPVTQNPAVPAMLAAQDVDKLAGTACSSAVPTIIDGVDRRFIIKGLKARRRTGASRRTELPELL